MFVKEATSCGIFIKRLLQAYSGPVRQVIEGHDWQNIRDYHFLYLCQEVVLEYGVAHKTIC